MTGSFFDGPGLPLRGAEQAIDVEWDALLERLYVRARGGMVLGLERMQAVLEELGHPERRVPAVHVAGSNGKGSTAAFMASILAQADEGEIGLYTSPHLSCLSERFQLVDRSGTAKMSRDDLLPIFRRLEALAPDFSGLTFFEIVTAAGLVAFAERGVSVLVAEAGLGARLDATRLVDAQVSVLTSIDLEHCAILGDTLPAIAAEKAFVARPGRPLFMAAAPPEVTEVVLRHTAGIGAPVFMVGRDFSAEASAPHRYRFRLGDRVIDDIQLALRGPHQVDNALLAARAVLELRPDLGDEVFRRGLAGASWPGRFELFARSGAPTIVFDGAHNPAGVRSLIRAIEAEVALRGRPVHLVLGILEDKAAAEMLALVCEHAASLALCPPPSPRALAPSELARMLPPASQGHAHSFDDPASALAFALDRAASDDGLVLVAGSLYLVGALRPSVLAMSYRPIRPGLEKAGSESLPRASGEC